MKKLTLRGFHIQDKSMKERQVRKISELYKEYKAQALRLSPEANLATKGEFTQALFQRGKGETVQRFMQAAASKSAGVLTTYQAKLTKNEAIGLGIDMTGRTLASIRKDKALQSEIYQAKKSEGLSSEELQDWWTEHIIGSD